MIHIVAVTILLIITSLQSCLLVGLKIKIVDNYIKQTYHLSRPDVSIGNSTGTLRFQRCTLWLVTKADCVTILNELDLGTRDSCANFHVLPFAVCEKVVVICHAGLCCWCQHMSRSTYGLSHARKELIHPVCEMTTLTRHVV